MYSGQVNPSYLLAFPFRLFFFCAAAFALFIVLAWVGFLLGGLPLSLPPYVLQWHSHEMIFGFAAAAIAGFILTAITNWTGCRPVKGYFLLGVGLLWIAGRIAMLFAGSLLPLWVALIDISFLFWLTAYVLVTLVRHKNKRNIIVLAALIGLLCCNILMHIGFITQRVDWINKGELLALDFILLLLTIIAGRIIPAFSNNWLRSQGIDKTGTRIWKPIEIMAIGGVIFIGAMDILSLPQDGLAPIVLAVSVVHMIRLVGWAGWKTRQEPLLWILHVAYLWLVATLLARGASNYFSNISVSVWQHLLGVGAMATAILGVMTRVIMGHTGRPLRLLPYGITIYIAISLAVIFRILTALHVMDFRAGICLSAFAWFCAFASFLAIYTPVLLRARADGKPG